MAKIKTSPPKIKKKKSHHGPLMRMAKRDFAKLKAKCGQPMALHPKRQGSMGAKFEAIPLPENREKTLASGGGLRDRLLRLFRMHDQYRYLWIDC